MEIGRLGGAAGGVGGRARHSSQRNQPRGKQEKRLDTDGRPYPWSEFQSYWYYTIENWNKFCIYDVSNILDDKKYTLMRQLACIKSMPIT